MSAHIVSTKTIDKCVYAFVRPLFLESPNKEFLDKVGQVLVNENFKSVNRRYKEQEDSYEYEYEDVYMDDKNNLYSLYKALRCLDYQSCECDDYEKTTAYYINNSAQKDIERQLNKSSTEIIDSYEFSIAEWD